MERECAPANWSKEAVAAEGRSWAWLTMTSFTATPQVMMKEPFQVPTMSFASVSKTLKSTQAALHLKENSAVSWNAVLVVHSTGQGWEPVVPRPFTFLFPCVMSSKRQDVWIYLGIQLILQNGQCCQGNPHSAFLAVPIILPPW